MDEETRHLGIRVDRTLSARLEAQARREGNAFSISATVRRLITKQLDQEEAAVRRATLRRGE
jgi:hypothetical protein